MELKETGWWNTSKALIERMKQRSKIEKRPNLKRPTSTTWLEVERVLRKGSPLHTKSRNKTGCRGDSMRLIYFGHHTCGMLSSTSPTKASNRTPACIYGEERTHEKKEMERRREDKKRDCRSGGGRYSTVKHVKYTKTADYSF